MGEREGGEAKPRQMTLEMSVGMKTEKGTDEFVRVVRNVEIDGNKLSETGTTFQIQYSLDRAAPL